MEGFIILITFAYEKDNNNFGLWNKCRSIGL